MFTNYWAKTDVYTSQHKDPFRTPAVLNPNHTLIADLRGARFPDGIPNASSDLARNGAVEAAKLEATRRKGLPRGLPPAAGHQSRLNGVVVVPPYGSALSEVRSRGWTPDPNDPTDEYGWRGRAGSDRARTMAQHQAYHMAQRSTGYLCARGAGYETVGVPPPGVPLPPAHMPWASPATETGAEFEPAFKGTLHVNEIGFKAAHHGKRFQEMARANRESYAAAATEAAVKAGARPTISTATLFRHQYPNTLGRYKAYQEQKEWK